MNADAARVLHDYNRWAWARVWASVEAAPPDTFTAPVDFSLGSVRAQLVHAIDRERRWLTVLATGALPDVLQPDAYPTLAHVRALWDDVQAQGDAAHAALTDDDLTRKVTYTARGAERQNSVRQLLLHVVNHGTDHRAQTLYTLHRLGQPTEPQDFIFYTRQTEHPARATAVINPVVLNELYDYTFARRLQVVNAARALTYVEASRPLDYSLGTLTAQLDHLTWAHALWLQRITGVAMTPQDVTSPARTRTLLRTLDEAELQRTFDYATSDGTPRTSRVWEALYHLVNHDTDHRAQALAFLHELGAPTFDQDYLLWLWERDEEMEVPE